MWQQISKFVSLTRVLRIWNMLLDHNGVSNSSDARWGFQKHYLKLVGVASRLPSRRHRLLVSPPLVSRVHMGKISFWPPPLPSYRARCYTERKYVGGLKGTLTHIYPPWYSIVCAKVIAYITSLCYNFSLRCVELVAWFCLTPVFTVIMKQFWCVVAGPFSTLCDWTDFSVYCYYVTALMCCDWNILHMGSRPHPISSLCVYAVPQVSHIHGGCS